VVRTYYWHDPETGAKMKGEDPMEVSDKLVHHWLGLTELNEMMGCDVRHWTEEQIFEQLLNSDEIDVVKRAQRDRVAAALYDDALQYFGYDESKGCAR